MIPAAYGGRFTSPIACLNEPTCPRSRSLCRERPMQLGNSPCRWGTARADQEWPYSQGTEWPVQPGRWCYGFTVVTAVSEVGAEVWHLTGIICVILCPKLYVVASLFTTLRWPHHHSDNTYTFLLPLLHPQREKNPCKTSGRWFVFPQQDKPPAWVPGPRTVILLQTHLG